MTLNTHSWVRVGLALALAPPTVATAADPADSTAYSMQRCDERLQRGIDLIYNLEFAAADRYFQEVIAAEPRNPAGHFFLAMVTWWRVLADLKDESHDQAFYDLLEQCIAVCDRRLEQDPRDFDAVICKGGAIGFRGRLRGDRDQYLHAASDGLKSLPLLQLSRELEPTNKDILFGQGIYNYFAEVMPREYPIVRPVVALLPSGDRLQGLQQLQQVVDEGYYARAEAAYFLAQIYRVFEKDNRKALSYLEQLHARYPGNALFHRYTARTLIEVGRWQTGVSLYQEVVRLSQGGRPGYHVYGQVEALYYIGKYAFYQGHQDEALQAFTAADSLAAGLPEDRVEVYVPLSELMLGMIYDMEGYREQAVARYRQVEDLPDLGNSHEMAAKFLKVPYRP